LAVQLTAYLRKFRK